MIVSPYVPSTNQNTSEQNLHTKIRSIIPKGSVYMIQKMDDKIRQTIGYLTYKPQTCRIQPFSLGTYLEGFNG